MGREMSPASNSIHTPDPIIGTAKNPAFRPATGAQGVAQPVGIPSSTIAQNWRDTFTLGVAGDWQVAPAWTLRAGYQYYQTPVPNSTFSPTIPDANQNVLTFGLAYRHNQHALEAAYGLDFYDRRNITSDQNPAYNGTYNLHVHLFSFSYRYSF